MFLPPRSTGRIQQRLSQWRFVGLDAAFGATSRLLLLTGQTLEREVAIGEVLANVIANEVIGYRMTGCGENLVGHVDAKLVASLLP